MYYVYGFLYGLWTQGWGVGVLGGIRNKKIERKKGRKEKMREKI